MPIETSVRRADPAAHQTSLLMVIVPQGEQPESLASLDQASGGAVGRLYAAGAFAGKRDQTAVLYPSGPAGRILLAGAGQRDDLDRAALRRAAAVATRVAQGMGVADAALYCVPEAMEPVTAGPAGQVLTEGISFGAWRFDELKEAPREAKDHLERVDLLASAEEVAPMSEGHAVGSAIAAGQDLARGLQMLPGNTCTPSYLAAVAAELGARHDVAVTVLERDAVTEEGLGGLLAVSQGSSQDPRFIVLEHHGADGPPIVLVGKGVTFDTGGISLKPPQKMEEMKFDMSGAAAVMGTFETLGRLCPRAHVVGLIPSAENMPSANSFKPGDVIRSHLGKTIEVVNTDAEGRLLLADALSYAGRFKPSCVLDMATLTGAVVMALGHTASGLMGNSEELLADVTTAAERAGEPVWTLPLWDEYKDLIKSDIADVKNSGGRPAGTISAGWFLKEFVDGFDWGHIDIAGTAYSDRSSPIMGKGPTGVGVRLFSEFVLARQA